MTINSNKSVMDGHRLSHQEFKTVGEWNEVAELFLALLDLEGLFCQQKSRRGEVSFTTEESYRKKSRRHNKSEIHLNVLDRMKDILVKLADKLLSFHSKQFQENKVCVKILVENILFLGKQCLTLRGNDESASSVNKWNYLELLELRSKDKVKEIHQIMSSCIHSSKSDSAAKEPESVCVRYPYKTSDAIGVSMRKMLSQAYYVASNMSSKFIGVAAIFKEKEPRALYTHCHAHLLDFAVMRFCEEVKPLQNTLNTVISLHNIFHASAKKSFKKYKHSSSSCLKRGMKNLSSIFGMKIKSCIKLHVTSTIKWGNTYPLPCWTRTLAIVNTNFLSPTQSSIDLTEPSFYSRLGEKDTPEKKQLKATRRA
uniref:(California timema) hypothetical protein n=1 Tax=Timema californicum TaxID=61474 RepID=A0A7R9J6B1_TIMCA|nr:unnamed protein product [Timema californicum]